MAPELVDNDGHTHHSVQSDIWAYGCLFLEVSIAPLLDEYPQRATNQLQSELRPYYKINDLSVIVALAQRQLPKRPSDISDGSWRLVIQCCAIEPTSRPSLETFLAQLNRLSMEVPDGRNEIARSHPGSLELTSSG